MVQMRMLETLNRMQQKPARGGSGSGTSGGEGWSSDAGADELLKGS